MGPSASNIDDALQIFGLSEFRPGQRDVIESIVGGSDCMCVMPTGGGKSLCYQLPSVIRSGLTIVVSPLIALMKDQVDGLARRGISAALINSTLSQSEQNSRLQDVASGKYQMVYVAPERLRNGRFIEAIRATPIQLLAVDEAHCISQWGHDFRPDYARIGRFRELLGGVQTVALTATATPRVREDIVKVLQLSRPKQFMSGFARPNLHFGVLSLPSEKEKEQELESFFSQERGAGIIYSATRKRCEALVDLLTQKLQLPKVGAYHAGLMPDQRRVVQERFMRDELRIIVATNAFGMGIDKPDLRFVIHYNMPGSLEAYYQEAGRAGRDSKRSQCVMLYSFQDRHIQEFFIDNSYPEKALIRQVYEFMLSREEDPIELTLEEIRDSIGVSVSPEAIGSCLQVISRTKVLDRLEMGSGLAMVRLDSRLPTLVDLVPQEAKVQRQVLRTVEKAVGSRRGEEVYLHPRWLIQESGLQRDAIGRALRALVKLDEFDYVPPFRGRAVHFRRRDVPFERLGIDYDNLQRRKDAEYDRLNQVVNYAQTPLCRQAAILKYFGDPSAENCGRCDRCQKQPGWPTCDIELPDAANGPTHDAESGANAPLQHAPAKKNLEPSGGTLLVLEKVLDAIQRIHGRLGKTLIAQYLCGSKNAKVQKLNLHRLSGFGILDGFRQADGVELLEAFLAAGILRQQEVNRNRPTISLAPELMDVAKRREFLGAVNVSPKLESKLRRLAPKKATENAARNVPSRVADHMSLPVETASEVAAPKDSEPPGLHSHLKQDAPSTPEQESEAADWNWSVRLLEQGYNWLEVTQIRRMTDEELASSLSTALRQGQSIESSWLLPVEGENRSAGQQKLFRELRRRASAGVT